MSPLVTQRIAQTPRWAKNELWRRARAVPSLDLRFADNKSLVDATTGQNLVTFTRASSGTYVDSQGVIRTATTNLLLRSEEFDNASWITSDASITPNAITAPNSALTADKLVENTAAAGHFLYQSFSWTANQSYVLSVHVKQAESGRYLSMCQRSGAAFSSNLGAIFDPADGSITTNTLGSGYAGSSSLGNGWFRCWIIVTPNASATASGVNIRLSDDGSTLISSYTGDGTSGIYLWGAQLEQSSTVGEYIPTTSTINSAPRFDHNPTTGESLGLLVEEQRSNLCLQSEAFGTSPWAASNVTVTANTATSPAATLTADTLAATSANGTVTQPVTTTAVAMTFSVYLKRKTGTGNIDITADGTTWVTQTINSSTWTRCIVTQTAVAGTSNPGIRIVTSGDEVYAWGGQYE